ncbi:MAG: hypothetical protein ACRDPO_07110 [Streptosporangiaceae bacterium]
MPRSLGQPGKQGTKSAGHPGRPAMGWTAIGATGLVAAAGILVGAWPATAALVKQAPQVRAARATGTGAAVEWAGFAENAQHTAVSSRPPEPLKRIRWRAKVDLTPVIFAKALLAHYASPMITAANTVLVPTRVSAKAGFRVVAYSGTTGAQRWTLDTDYRPPVISPAGTAAIVFTPPLPAALTPSATLAVAGAGGTVLMREHANLKTGAVHRLVFYGAAQWKAHRSVYDKAVRISTPLTAGPDGSVYFGFKVTGATPAHLSSGIARIDASGHATWISAAAAARNRAVTGVAFSCAPALSPDGRTVYITVTSPASGILVGLNAATLRPRFRVTLKDPANGKPALVSSTSSATPMVGPDGDVYYGVLGHTAWSHDGRGWLLHYNASLTREKIPGSFGWDETVSLVPARAVPSYHGPSSYLLMSKYDNYIIGKQGDGRNKVAVLDPGVSQKDPFSKVKTMKVVKSILSPDHEPGTPAGARYEWCINSAVVDPADDSVFVNSEDGMLYRWDLATNTLAEKIRLNAPRGESYTPTMLGPDGTVYAINNGTLYAVGR